MSVAFVELQVWNITTERWDTGFVNPDQVALVLPDSNDDASTFLIMQNGEIYKIKTRPEEVRARLEL